MDFDKLLFFAFAIYATFVPGVGVEKELNERRDKILDLECKYSKVHKWLIYNNDWKGIYWFYLLYQIGLVVLLLILGFFAYFGPAKVVWATFALCVLITLVATGRLILTFIFFGKDRKEILARLGDLKY